MKKIFVTISIFIVTTLYFLFFISNVSGDGDSEDYFRREHSLSRPYQGSGWQVPYWDFYGSTLVTNQYVRLTPDLKSHVGGLWNVEPVRMKGWEVHIQFQIHGRGKDLFGDGFAFWYSKERMVPGTVFGSKDLFHGLAIIVDTYSNHNGPHNHGHPYISAMVNNGTLAYDHDRDGTHTQIAGCAAAVRNTEQDTFLSIRYDNDILTVSTDLEGEHKWKECFRVEGVQLPSSYYFGVSAATGDLSDNHDIIFIKTYDIGGGVLSPQELLVRDMIQPTALSFSPPREHIDEPAPPPVSKGTSVLKIFMYCFMGILAVGAFLIVGIIVYQNHQQNSRKRFY